VSRLHRFRGSGPLAPEAHRPSGRATLRLRAGGAGTGGPGCTPPTPVVGFRADGGVAGRRRRVGQPLGHPTTPGSRGRIKRGGAVSRVRPSDEGTFPRADGHGPTHPSRASRSTWVAMRSFLGCGRPTGPPRRRPRLSPAAAGPPRPPRARPRGGVRGRPDDGRIPGCRGRRTSPARPSPPPAAPPRGQRRGAPLWRRRVPHGGHRAPPGAPAGASRAGPGWGAVRGTGGTPRPRPPSRAPPRTARGT